MKNILLFAIVIIGVIIIAYMFRKQLGIEKYFVSTNSTTDNSTSSVTDTSTSPIIVEKEPVWGATYPFNWIDTRNSAAFGINIGDSENNIPVGIAGGYTRMGFLSLRPHPLRINDYVKVIIREGDASLEGIYKVKSLGWGGLNDPRSPQQGQGTAFIPELESIKKDNITMNKHMFRIDVKNQDYRVASKGLFQKLMNKEELTEQKLNKIVKNPIDKK